MKPFILFSFLFFGLIISSTAQKSDKKQNLPREKSKVTREYDEKGNLIRFDSVYSYSYSSDSTLINNFSPKDFSSFGFFNDSTFNGNSFLGDFDKMFAHPFSHFDQKQDSIFRKRFEGSQYFQDFNNDSIALNYKDLDEMLGRFFESNRDSTLLNKKDKITGKSQPQSMDDVMLMFRKQLQEIEKRQQKFFGENEKLKEF